MPQLLLLRHAKSSWDEKELPDRDRPLAPRGRRAAATIRQAMHSLGLTPDLVLVSPARRAMQTAEALEPWDETPLTDSVEALYLATASQMFMVLREVPGTVRSALVIGHNPGMHELALALVGAGAMAKAGEAERQLAAGFPTGALAELYIPGPWSQLDPGGGRLLRFLTPRQLERVG